MKKFLKTIITLLGYEIRPLTDKFNVAEFSQEERELLRRIKALNISMASDERLINTLKSCKHIEENNIKGAFVECGVWRGGNAILAKLYFELNNSDREVWLYDTFTGMTEPTAMDTNHRTGLAAIKKYRLTQKRNYNNWCYASLEDVRNNCRRASVDVEKMHFVMGDVTSTLTVSDNLPESISVLRLDTDWYESTKTELEVLYPLISKGGILIIDDYGAWDGARAAVDEYFSKHKNKPLLNYIDPTGRSVQKF